MRETVTKLGWSQCLNLGFATTFDCLALKWVKSGECVSQSLAYKGRKSLWRMFFTNWLSKSLLATWGSNWLSSIHFKKFLNSRYILPNGEYYNKVD